MMPCLAVIAMLSTGVLPRHFDPPTGFPDVKDAVGWADFMDKWGPVPPWDGSINRPRGHPWREVKSRNFSGTVVGVGDEFLEVVPMGEVEAVRLKPHFLLATGRVIAWEGDSRCYLLEDLKKGDWVGVQVGVDSDDRGLELFTLSIGKRPGGTIPASRKPDKHRPWHYQIPAEHDFVDKGSPLPDDIKPDRGLLARAEAARKQREGATGPAPVVAKPPEAKPEKKDK